MVAFRGTAGSPAQEPAWERGTGPRSGWLVLVVVVVLAAAVTSRDAASPPDEPLAVETAAEVVHRPDPPGPAAVLADGVARLDARVHAHHPGVHAVLVSIDGQPVVERSFGGAFADAVDVGPATATVLSLLVGVAIEQGLIRGVDATLGELLPRHVGPATPAQTAGITVEQLLTMTSGLPDGGAPGGFATRGDWVRAILDTGTFAPPGTAFAHSDAAAHLLSVIVAEATGRSALAYAQEELFAPLGVTATAWATDPQGYHLGFDGLELAPADLLRLGELVLQAGSWEGDRLLSPEHVRRSTTPSGAPGASERFGYLWVLGTRAGLPAFHAAGFRGPLLEVVPDLGAVIVMTSDRVRALPPPHVVTLHDLVDDETLAALSRVARQEAVGLPDARPTGAPALPR